MLIWYFLTDKPPLYTVLEDKLGHLPETQPGTSDTPTDAESGVRGLPVLVQGTTVKMRVWVGTSGITDKGWFATIPLILILSLKMLRLSASRVSN